MRGREKGKECVNAGNGKRIETEILGVGLSYNQGTSV